MNFPEFHKYAARLRAQGHEVFSPAEVRIPQDNIRTIFAVETDWLCREAEAVYLMPGWSRSRGARAERALAEALDLGILPHLNENNYQLERPSLTTSPSPSQKLPKSPLLDKSNMELPDGTELSQPTSLTPLSAIISTGVLLIVMAFVILLSWLGGH